MTNTINSTAHGQLKGSDMQKPLPVVRKHHYVWAYYLSAWSNGNNKNIWHETSKGLIRHDSIKGLAREQDFNKIHALSDKDIFFIERWPGSDSPALQKFHKSQIAYFKKASTLIDCHIGHEHLDKYAELKNLSEAIQFGIFEKTHTAIENLAKPILDDLKLGNTSILQNNQHMTNFCNFIAQQLLRTKKVKDKSLESMQPHTNINPVVKMINEMTTQNWWIISYRLALNLGHSLSSSATLDHHTLIKNETKIDFITSDCPVINIHKSAENQTEGYPPESLDLYFPISPKLAYIISAEDKYNALASGINEKAVKQLNIKIAKNSHLSIFGTSHQSIKDTRQGYR